MQWGVHQLLDELKVRRHRRCYNVVLECLRSARLVRRVLSYRIKAGHRRDEDVVSCCLWVQDKY